jgi:hypothetical protein
VLPHEGGFSVALALTLDGIALGGEFLIFLLEQHADDQRLEIAPLPLFDLLQPPLLVAQEGVVPRHRRGRYRHRIRIGFRGD